ncbi:nucleotidyltransferase family protein [Aquibium oceanicum]|uniref:Nucleotidyltransferase-like domain-containing protein n=1 Tax=Aquibium oceanicum TaxID=1670800 RepID=A0A1L3SNL6_9HYPH|nr:GSU2403 family nucleotidyltransferase fold protein [Aquibium oceanicum]APH70970.1 hypothetical protein BSQ44_05950 [Aquibium oceanicum]
MQPISHIYQTVYSELAERALDATFKSDFDLRGRFVIQEVKGRRYWYFDLPEDGTKKRTYVGPVDDEEITRRVENFKDLKADNRERRRLVSTLVREAYLPRAEALTGDIIKALAAAGFFRLRGVLIGTVAYQCYPPLIGVRLPNTAMVTSDADFAQFHSISVAVGDAMPPILETLRAVDETFREIPDRIDGRKTTRFANRAGYKVEFLTSNTGSDDYGGKPTAMPALGGASAQPLRFLDFLIHQPMRGVLLHGAGVPVLVPSPERYAIHKLIVSSRRRMDDDRPSKSRKDVAQATAIIVAMMEQRRGDDVADAFMEARDRWPAWREALLDGLSSIEDGARATVTAGLSRGIVNLGSDPEAYGLKRSANDDDKESELRR